MNPPQCFSWFFLHVMGKVAFDYQFGATNDAEDPLAKALPSVSPMFSMHKDLVIFVLGLLELLPLQVLRFRPLEIQISSGKPPLCSIQPAGSTTGEKQTSSWACMKICWRFTVRRTMLMDKPILHVGWEQGDLQGLKALTTTAQHIDSPALRSSSFRSKGGSLLTGLNSRLWLQFMSLSLHFNQLDGIETNLLNKITGVLI
ncbi:hypothetical protein C8R43DRAFT_1133137 [Mycena crocata]|nr:hypothetical protein C8R43DRAFT_1133137 [Mycena crocata]